MPGEEAKNGVSAGISHQSVDVAEVFESLKREVRRTGAPPADDGAALDAELAARADAERLWAVAVDVPTGPHPGVRGRAVHLSQRVLGKLMSWYVGPFAADQRGFNHAAVCVLDAFEQRLLRLERRGTRAVAPGSDYFGLEERMRGTTSELRERRRPYVDDFRDSAPVLDVGCGRGELLALLRDAGIEARGVEGDADMVAQARGEGLEVDHGDALAYLERLPDESLGGLFSAQVVEHLPGPALVQLLELAEQKLRPGGVLVVETINPLSPLALRNYFSDLTHVQPLVPDTLAILCRQAGFRVGEVRYLNEPERRLRRVDPAELGAAGPALAYNVDLLNEHVFAPLDYAIVARKE